MADSLRYKDWHNKANADLKSAKILFDHEADHGIVAFHCQQAIKKLLKSFILKRASALIDGHSLVFLCKKSIEIDAEFKIFLKDCAYINQFYIETRYPMAFTPQPLAHPTDTDALAPLMPLMARMWPPASVTLLHSLKIILIRTFHVFYLFYSHEMIKSQKYQKNKKRFLQHLLFLCRTKNSI